METRKMISEELQQVAPLLSQLKVTVPFTVPENYFEELPGRIVNRVEVKHPAQTVMQKSADEDSFYSVPENYFETLTQDVLKKVHERSVNVPVRRMPAAGNRSMWLAAASVCLLLAFSSALIFNFNSTDVIIPAANNQQLISSPASQPESDLESVSDMDESFILDASGNSSFQGHTSASAIQPANKTADLQDISDLDLETINVSLN